MNAVFPSDETATEAPARLFPELPVGTSLPPCEIQPDAVCANTQSAPSPPPSPGSPMTAVAPSAESATLEPKFTDEPSP